MPDLTVLQTILIDAAASQLPSPEKAKKMHQTSKADGSIVTEIDANLQREISKKLKENWPHIPLLGEEMRHDQQDKMLEYSQTGLWVLDPLDGTTNFTNGIPIFGLSLAYVKNGETIKAVIYDPNRKECFSAEQGKGAYLNGQRLYSGGTTSLSKCLANVDYKRLTEVLSSRLVHCPPYRSQRNLGSCVLEWCWLAADRIQLYLHGGQQLWDHAGGRLILIEAGGAASRIEGDSMNSSRLIKQSVVAASNPKLFRAWFSWIQKEG